MSAYEKLLLKILRGFSDKNIPFLEMCELLKKCGFDERIKGDHHIFTKDNTDAIVKSQIYKNTIQ